MAVDPATSTVLDALLRRRLGYALDPWPQALWERLETLARRAKVSPALLLARADDAVLAQLTAAATITHTAFFRHPEHFVRLEADLRKRRSRKTRILSAACSRGEEPYSLALTAERANADVEIEALDINADAIAHAERGHYDAVTARDVPGVDPVRGWSAPASIRRRIHFECCSLNEGLARRTAVYDYVFCRNVLIYFPPPAALAMVEQLRACLAADGALVVAPTEALAALPSGLARSSPLGWLVREASGAPLVAAEWNATGPKRPARLGDHPVPSAASASRELEQVLAPSLRQQTDEADLVLWLEARPDDAVAWFLLGEKLVQRGEHVQARVAYSQVITHAAQASLVEPDTLRAAAQRRLNAAAERPGGERAADSERYLQSPRRK